MTTREHALEAARAHFDSGAFLGELVRRVAYRTESQDAASAPALAGYLADEMGPSLASLGFTFAIHPNPVREAVPFLIAERHEGGELPTALIYGHGDVIRGQDKSWTRGAGPWQLQVDGPSRAHGSSQSIADHRGEGASGCHPRAHAIRLGVISPGMRVPQDN